MVLIEGDVSGPGPKIEVWREETSTPPIATERSDITAVVSDDAPAVDIPVWPRAQVAVLADEVLRRAETV